MAERGDFRRDVSYLLEIREVGNEGGVEFLRGCFREIRFQW